MHAKLLLLLLLHFYLKNTILSFWFSQCMVEINNLKCFSNYDYSGSRFSSSPFTFLYDDDGSS